MNAAEKRKQIGQIVILVVLLSVLGISLAFMMRTVARVGGGAKPAVQQTQAVPAADQQTAPASTAGEQDGTTGDLSASTMAGGLPEQFNPNVFRIYNLDPPKNPFVQEERWYTEELTAGLPGYPELRDSGFFEDVTTAIPPIDNLLEEGESWRNISMIKVEDDQEYTIVGTSEDGKIQTNVVYTGEPGRSVAVDWDRRSGIPVSALADADWGGRLPDSIPADLQDGSDLFSPGGDGLSIPGMGDLFSDGGSGEYIACQGVSGYGQASSALIIYNELPRIIQAGDSLPPRYVVDAVTENGVILRDIKDNETKWLPIGGQTSVSGGTVGGIKPPVTNEPCVTSS